MVMSPYSDNLIRIAELTFPYREPSAHQAFEAVNYLAKQVALLNDLGYPLKLKTAEGADLTVNGDLLQSLRAATKVVHSPQGSDFRTHLEVVVSDDRGSDCARFFISSQAYMPGYETRSTQVIARTGNGLFALETDFEELGGKTDAKLFFCDIAEGIKKKYPDAKPVKGNYEPGMLRVAACYIAERARAFKNG